MGRERLPGQQVSKTYARHVKRLKPPTPQKVKCADPFQSMELCLEIKYGQMEIGYAQPA